MTSSFLAIAGLAALLAGQTSADRQAYAEYQRRLNAILASEAATVPSATPVSATPAAAATAASTCLLAPGSGNTATTSDCTACHATHRGSRSHPVDVFQMQSPSLRPAAEVVRRGVFLLDGKVSCLSCHDGSSPWKYKIALPPDAKLREPVKPGDPSTYDPTQMAPSRMAGLTATTGRQVLPAGTEVSPTPLCKACHAFD